MNTRNINITMNRLVSIRVARRCNDTVDKKWVKSCVLKAPLLEGVQQPKKNVTKKGGEKRSDTVFHPFFDPSEENKFPGVARVNKVTPVSLGYPLSVLNKKLYSQKLRTERWEKARPCCNWRASVWRHSSKKKKRERVGQAPPGGCGLGFGLVPSYTTISVRVRANMNLVPSKLKVWKRTSDGLEVRVDILPRVLLRDQVYAKMHCIQEFLLQT